jgi:hypothetical protein
VFEVKVVARRCIANHHQRRRPATPAGRQPGRYLVSCALALSCLALAACSGSPPGPDGAERPPFPELNAFPTTPPLEGTLEDRRQIGNELLADRTRQVQSAAELDYRVGRTDAPPPEPPPPPVMPPTPPPPPLLPRAASADVDATFLRQQIYSEINSDSLNFYMDVLARAPVDIDPLSAQLSLERQEAASRGSQFFGSGPGVATTPVLPSWTSYEPTLDGWLRTLGLMPEPPPPSP